MKFTKKSKTLFFGLTLVLSLVSFSGFPNYATKADVSTTLVITGYDDDANFHLQFQKTYKIVVASLLWDFDFSFIKFQNYYNLKETIAFKTNKSNSLSFIREQLRAKLYTIFTHKTLYNSIA